MTRKRKPAARCCCGRVVIPAGHDFVTCISTENEGDHTRTACDPRPSLGTVRVFAGDEGTRRRRG